MLIIQQQEQKDLQLQFQLIQLRRQQQVRRLQHHSLQQQQQQFQEQQQTQIALIQSPITQSPITPTVKEVTTLTLPTELATCKTPHPNPFYISHEEFLSQINGEILSEETKDVKTVVDKKESKNDLKQLTTQNIEPFGSDINCFKSIKEFFETEPQCSSKSFSGKMIYVLELSNGTWYVGRSKNVYSRVRDHMESKGAVWTSRSMILRIALAQLKSDFDEENITVQFMIEKGIQYVRGAQYSQVVLSEAKLHELQQKIYHMKDLCFNCGSGEHFLRDCPNNKTNKPSTSKSTSRSRSNSSFSSRSTRSRSRSRSRSPLPGPKSISRSRSPPSSRSYRRTPSTDRSEIISTHQIVQIIPRLSGWYTTVVVTN
jgi:hypothetical protein